VTGRLGTSPRLARGVDIAAPQRADSDQWIIVGTDGSARPNPGPAGWAWIVDQESWQAGPMIGAWDNNAAELTAVCELLTNAPLDAPLWIATDSRVVERLMARDLPGIVMNRGRTFAGRPYPYAVLAFRLAGLLAERTRAGGRQRIQWINAHTVSSMRWQHWLNRAADDLAYQAARAAARGAMQPRGPGWTARASTRRGDLR
jgi:ribonuclease HI